MSVGFGEQKTSITLLVDQQVGEVDLRREELNSIKEVDESQWFEGGEKGLKYEQVSVLEWERKG